MSGTGSLTKIGTGTVVLTGTNTYTGTTTINGGALLLGSEASVAPGSIILNNGTIGNAQDVSLTISRPVTITNSGGFQTTAYSKLTWSGVIGGSGTLVKSGNGDVILTGANTYAGGTTVTGGVLRFNSDANLGLAGTGITLNGGSVGTTKDTPAATSIGRDLALAGNGGINVALHPLIWSGNISGAGQLIINGSGELELTGTNTYSGGTRLDEEPCGSPQMTSSVQPARVSRFAAARCARPRPSPARVPSILRSAAHFSSMPVKPSP